MTEEKIKTEQKLLPQRLMSFRGSRDLSLGSRNASKSCVGLANNRDKSRKQFTPNVNVQRKKNQDIRVKEEFIKDERRHARGSRGRGQGRGRHSSTLVQASGSVFADGIAVSTVATARRSGYGSSRYDSGNSKDNVLEMPKLNLKQNCKVDKEEEDRKLNELLRDNFIDNSELEPDPLFAPISLPLNANKKVDRDIKFKVEQKVKKENVEFVGGVKIKQEIVENGENGNNLHLNIGETSIPSFQIKEEPRDVEENYGGNLLHSLNIQEKKLILIQLPDRLPALSTDPLETNRPNSSVKSKPGPSVNNQDNSEKKYCQLSDLAPGHVGTLQIRRSGKVELVLGKCILNVASGTAVSFQQDLVAIQLHSDDQHSGESIDLGPITTRLICTPDWNSLLKCGGKF